MAAVCQRRNHSATDIEDGAQDLVLRLVDTIFHGRQPPRPGEENAYVSKCASNAALDLISAKGKYKHRRFEREMPEGDSQADAGRSVAAEHLEHEQLMATLTAALHELPETYREVVEAYYFRGTPLTLIAQQWLDEGRASTLKKAEQNVQAARRRGLARLRLLANTHLEES